jgi:hypothetical protein
MTGYVASKRQTSLEARAFDPYYPEDPELESLVRVLRGPEVAGGRLPSEAGSRRFEGHAFGVEEPWIDGWDCTVVFDDEVVGSLEWEKLDQLRENLAASEGISEVLQEDREVFHLKVLGLDYTSVEVKVAGAIEQTDIGDPADRR